ncbi:hypothetical protein ACFWFU_04270 [Streptomyces sp. NPDC060235]|uniref:hypothetical protein n=1 Tax=Streptomyces sp. NPDC060235 TaxID=3347080 RepID=UPI00365BA99B
MTFVVTPSIIPIPIGPQPLPEVRGITAMTVLLVIVILLAVVVLVGVGCTPPTAVAAVAGASLIAGNLRRELS